MGIFRKLAAGAAIASLCTIGPALGQRSDDETYWEGGGWTVTENRQGRRGASADRPQGSFLFCITTNYGAFGDGKDFMFSAEEAGWTIYVRFTLPRRFESGGTTTGMEIQLGDEDPFIAPANFNVYDRSAMVFITLDQGEDMQARIAAAEQMTITSPLRNPNGQEEAERHTYLLSGHGEALAQTIQCAADAVAQDQANPPTYEAPPPRRSRRDDEDDRD